VGGTRDWLPAKTRNVPNLFQSSPGWLAGRCLLRPAIIGCKDSFNPRPAGWPGAARPIDPATAAMPVSILARLVGRALRIAGQPTVHLRDVSILARLVGRALLKRVALSAEKQMFQSSPGWLAGRCLCIKDKRVPCRGFNPRPAGWPGAAGDINRLKHQIEVSILARLVGRALQG